MEPFAKFASRWDLLPGRVVIPGSAGVPPAQDLAGSWRLASQGWSVHLPTGAGAAPLQECGRDARAPRGKPMAGQVQIRILQKAQGRKDFHQAGLKDESAKGFQGVGKDSKGIREGPRRTLRFSTNAHSIIEPISFLCTSFSSCLSCLSCVSMFNDAANRISETWPLLPIGIRTGCFTLE